MVARTEVPEPQALHKPAAVEVEHLSIRFKTTRERNPSLRRTLAQLRGPMRRTQWVHALNDVTFTIPTGSVFGVIGPNGAGKSTLLRTIAGILTPDEGQVRVSGRVTPLLSVGLGFNRELTGRENILIGGLANGIPLEEIREHHEEIIEYTELGDAIDYPMRTYSSGMCARLGFAVAAQLDPEILLLDEALGAGDAAFRRKSTRRIMELCANDTTVVLVSHGLEVVKLMAEECVWIEQGAIRSIGEAPEVVDDYLASQGMDEDETEAMEEGF